MRYQLIRDKRIFDLQDHEIEICDDTDEINNFSVKEIMNLLNELKESEFADTHVYVDIYAILKNMTRNNEISDDEVEIIYQNKLKTKGEFSKYLIKIK